MSQPGRRANLVRAPTVRHYLVRGSSPVQGVTNLPMTGDVADDRRRLRALRVEDAELRRLLEKHQWSGLTPASSTDPGPGRFSLRRATPLAEDALPGFEIATPVPWR